MIKNKSIEEKKEMVSKNTKLILNQDFQRTDFWEYCDNCGHKMTTRKCKLICPKCGFFHSCSEP